jgi:hypothetical protein
MAMYAHPNGKYLNTRLVTNCQVTQLDKNIFQAVYEFGKEHRVLFSHGTFEEAEKDLSDFVAFCNKHEES